MVVSFFVTIIAAIIPAFVWLVFFLREDIHPEPKRLILYAFEIGALASIPALLTQVVFQKTILFLGANVMPLIIGLALIEELYKFISVYWIIHRHPAFDEPIDAMIYMIAGAAGFATVENLFIAASVGDGFNFSVFLGTANVLTLRFIGATLLHTLASALIGYYWAYGIIKNREKHFIIIGIAVATIIHAIFNYLVLQFQNTTLLYPSIFLVIATFFVLNDFEKLKTIPGNTKTSNVLEVQPPKY